VVGFTELIRAGMAVCWSLDLAVEGVGRDVLRSARAFEETRCGSQPWPPIRRAVWTISTSPESFNGRHLAREVPVHRGFLGLSHRCSPILGDERIRGDRLTGRCAATPDLSSIQAWPRVILPGPKSDVFMLAGF